MTIRTAITAAFASTLLMTFAPTSAFADQYVPTVGGTCAKGYKYNTSSGMCWSLMKTNLKSEGKHQSKTALPCKGGARATSGVCNSALRDDGRVWKARAGTERTKFRKTGGTPKGTLPIADQAHGGSFKR